MALPMNNSGHGKLQVPGFGNVPLTYELPCQDRFSHGIEEWVQLPAVTLKEFAMTAAMNSLTDKEEWHKHVHDSSILQQWKDEVFASFDLMTDTAWDWCVQELRDKAVYLEEKRFIQVLDTGSCVCKSDDLLPATFASELRTALQPLLKAKAKATGEDLVDPYAHPLVYGVTGVLQDGGSTRLDHHHLLPGLYAHGRATFAAPEQHDDKTDADEVDQYIRELLATGIQLGRCVGLFQTNPRQYYWSTRYQALPCDLAFLPGEGTRVRIETYVNDLHPFHKAAYSCLEAIVAAAIDPWNECLIAGGPDWLTERLNRWHNGIHDLAQTQRGRKPLRIVTFGAQFDDALPNWALALDGWIQIDLDLAEDDEYRSEGALSPRQDDYIQDLKALIPLVKPDVETWEKAEEYLRQPLRGSTVPVELPRNWRSNPMWHLTEKASPQMRARHPEPGTVFSYSEWRDCRNVEKAIVEMDDRAIGLGPAPKLVPPTFTPYTVQLEKTFHDKGLQIITRIGNLELAAGDKHGETWHLQGCLNEHVVATAIFVFESSNVSARIYFRQETPMPGLIYRDDGLRASRWVKRQTATGESEYHFVAVNHAPEFEKIFGLPESVRLSSCASDYLSFQETGNIKLSQGRLLTFPNSMESRMEVELIEKSQKGRLGYVLLNLVDPHYRVCSTRNVPPQQTQWNDPLFRVLFKRKGLPDELINQILQYYHTQEVPAYAQAAMRGEINRLTMARYAQMPWRTWFDDDDI